MRNVTPAHDHLNIPHGGALVDQMARSNRRAELLDRSKEWRSWDLTPLQLCDTELLLNGAFSPLRGFMTRRECDSVCDSMRLPCGLLWPLPVVLDVPEDFARASAPGERVALRDAEGVLLACLTVEDVWQADWSDRADQIYGTSSREHPGVAALLDRCHSWCLGGAIEGVALPHHYDSQSLRHTPAELRAQFSRSGWRRVVAFQTRNPLHRAHVELTLRAAAEAQANILIQPVVGMTMPGDVDHYTRLRCYRAVMGRYAPGTARLSLLPLAMRMAGPREALLHAIIRKNYGCSHLVVGRDHAGPGSRSDGTPFYGAYAAQALLREHEEELGLRVVSFREMVYVEELDKYRTRG